MVGHPKRRDRVVQAPDDRRIDRDRGQCLEPARLAARPLMEVLDGIRQHRHPVVVRQTLCQRGDLGIIGGPPRHERALSQPRRQHLRGCRRRGLPARRVIEQGELVGRQIGQRKVDVRIRDEDVQGQFRRLRIGQHPQGDDAHTAAPIVGHHAVVTELPHLGDQVHEQPGVVVQRIAVRGRWLLRKPVPGEVHRADVELRVEFAGQRGEVDAGGREAVHEHQPRCARGAAASAEEPHFPSAVLRCGRLPPDLGRATPPVGEDIHPASLPRARRRLPNGQARWASSTASRALARARRLFTVPSATPSSAAASLTE